MNFGAMISLQKLNESRKGSKATNGTISEKVYLKDIDKMNKDIEKIKFKVKMKQ
jgi:hypothetical protein